VKKAQVIPDDVNDEIHSRQGVVKW
jgi:hypothetical protein